jgi:predicted O-methyltransferase YrrM
MRAVRGASRLARLAARRASPELRRELVTEVMRADPASFIDAVTLTVNPSPSVAAMPVDLESSGQLEFEDLAGLFSSSILNHGVISMPIRQAAYVFGLARRSGARTAIEVGRWRGGSTILLAAALGPGGKVWSIDVGEKETRVFGDAGGLDAQTKEFCERYGLDVELLVGDSRTIEVDTGDVDLVLIDGEHSYDAATNDFERFGRRVRVGGVVLFDDVGDDPIVPALRGEVDRAVEEAIADGDFALQRIVDRLAHVERVRG